MYLIQPSSDIIEGRVKTAETDDNPLLQGCRAYVKSNFEKAEEEFEQVNEEDDPFYYEC